MSKIGQYVVGNIDLRDYAEDDAYWQAHEFGEEYTDTQPRRWDSYSPNLSDLPLDVREKLSKAGFDDFELYDDLPF